MDPQQRVLLEETVAAFRSAGHSAESLQGTPTGVFVGCIWLEYGELLAAAGHPPGAYMVTGKAQDGQLHPVSSPSWQDGGGGCSCAGSADRRLFCRQSLTGPACLVLATNPLKPNSNS